MRGDLALIAGIGLLGVLMAHWPMISSGFRKLQTDLTDSRLIEYLLEHGYLWIHGEPGHRDFWSPPFFYPARDTASYTDLLVSVSPPYWLYRALGAAPDLAFGLWMVTMSALNYAAGVLLFRKGLGLDPLPAATGAFLVAFGAPRLNQMGHPQLLPCFYVLLAVYALARLFSDPPPGRSMRWAYWLMASLVCVLQFYAGVYLAWFLVVGTGLSAAVALALRSCRRTLLLVVGRDMGAILVSAAAGLLLLSPFVRHSLPVLRQVARNQYSAMYRALHPYRISWLDMGTGNWVWGWTAGWPLFRPASYVDEHHLGFGLVTLIACAAGLYLGRNRPICRLAGVVGLAICVATTFMPRESLVLAARAVAFFCVAALFRDVEQPRSRAAGLTILLGFLLLVRFPNEYLQALFLGLIAICLLEIYRAGAARESRIIAAVALGMVCLKLFAVQVMPTATAFSAAVAAPTAIVLKRRWWALGRVVLVTWVLFLVAITYLDRPRIAIGGFAGVGVALAVVKRERLRPPARLMVRALPFALLIIIIYYELDSLWLRVYDWIPGGLGIRAVGRVVLIVLIPAALGLATLVQRLQRNGMQIAGWLLAVGCMVEQAVTTASYDAAANREKIQALARRVDPASETFYYRPCENRDWIRYQLDAMWASLASGKPTINGYSGYYPPDWYWFSQVEAECGPRPRDVLDGWIKARGLLRDRVQWIGSDCPDSGASDTQAH